MKKRLTVFFLSLVLIISTFSTGIFAAPAADVQTETTETATYLAGAISGTLDIDSYRDVFLIGASGIDSSEIANEYLDIVLATTADSISITQYGGIIMALRGCGIDPTDVGGRNLVAEFSDALNDPANATFFSTYSLGFDSPYKLVYIISSLNEYQSDITDSATHLASARAAVLDFYDTDNSYFDYWGGNADNDSKLTVGLKSFYDNSEADIITISDTAIASIKTALDGTNHSFGYDAPSVYPDPYGYGSSSNPSSTGLTLLALSTFDDAVADDVFTALLDYKVSGTPGAYHSAWSADPDPDFSTPDALEGLLAYKLYLNGGNSIYDLSQYTIYVPEVEIASVKDKNNNSVTITLSESAKLLTDEEAADLVDDVEATVLAVQEVTVPSDTEYPVTITFNVDGVTADMTVYVLHWNGSSWDKLEATAGNGTITCTFTELSPVAFVEGTETSTMTSPKTGQTSPILYISILMLCAATITFFSLRIKKKANQ